MKTWAVKGEHSNGYYTWPRFGYDQTIDELATQDVGSGRELANRIWQKFPNAKSILDLMETKEGRDWWKVNGVDLEQARFNLRDNSRSIKVYNAYLEERKNAK